MEAELTLVRKGAPWPARSAPWAATRPLQSPARANRVARRGRPAGRSAADPDRGRLLFGATTNDDVEHLSTIGTDGRGLRRLGHHNAFQMQPTWSPDGWRVAFTRAEPDPTPRHRPSP